MVKKLNWQNIQSSSDGGFEALPAGPYVAKIVDMVDKEDREYVEVVFDIAEGPKAGYYSDDWGKQHPYAHHFFMSYKQTALGMLKGRLEAIQKSNPGFDPFAAWDAGRLDMFVGRVVGINLQEEEYLNRDSEVRTRLNVCQVVQAQDVRDGKVKARPKKDLKNKPATSTNDTGVADDFDIPFD
jgi:hypothetical protein